MGSQGNFLPYGTIANAGQYGATAVLPTNPGPPDPVPGSGYTPSPIMQGYLDFYNSNLSAGGATAPANYGQMPGSEIPWNDPSSINLGVLSGGTNGPQGSVYGTDPQTGQPIYNVTGSPKPGFFDSKTGKVVENVASTGLNIFVPGLGFVSKAIFDAMRRRNAAQHTGTDLTHSQPAAAPSNNGPAPLMSGPTGVMDQTARFANNGITGNYTADKTTESWEAGGGYAGAPNRWASDSRDRFAPGSAGIIDPETGMLRGFKSPSTGTFQAVQGGPTLRADPNSADAYNAYLMQQPNYRAGVLDRYKALLAARSQPEMVGG